MDNNQRMMLAAQLRAMADQLLIPVSMATGIPEDMVQAFVRGSSERAVEAGKAAGTKKRKRKASAYSKAYGRAYKQLKKRHPRTQHSTLVKRAHAIAKKKRK